MNSTSYELGDLCGMPAVSYRKHHACYELSIDSDMNSLATRNGTAHGIEAEKTGVSSGKIKGN